MNIRIENELRLRLDQSDLQQLLKAKKIEKNFSIGKQFLFTIQVLLTDTTPQTTTSLSSQKYIIHLMAEDLAKLQQSEYKKNGLVVCNDPRIELQVDIFTKVLS
jgi:hypothetical protein